MPMEDEVRFWNPQNRDEVTGGPKAFYNGSVGSPTVKRSKTIGSTDEGVWMNTEMSCVFYVFSDPLFFK